MPYSDQDIDLKISQAVADAITAAGIAADLIYVKKDGSTPITSEQYIDSIITGDIGSPAGANLKITGDQQVNIHATNYVGIEGTLQVIDKIEIKKLNVGKLTLDATAITADRTQTFQDLDGEIDVN